MSVYIFVFKSYALRREEMSYITTTVVHNTYIFFHIYFVILLLARFLHRSAPL